MMMMMVRTGNQALQSALLRIVHSVDSFRSSKKRVNLLGGGGGKSTDRKTIFSLESECAKEERTQIFAEFSSPCLIIEIMRMINAFVPQQTLTASIISTNSSINESPEEAEYLDCFQTKQTKE